MSERRHIAEERTRKWYCSSGENTEGSETQNDSGHLEKEDGKKGSFFFGVKMQVELRTDLNPNIDEGAPILLEDLRTPLE